MNKYRCINCGHSWEGGYIGKCINCGSSQVSQELEEENMNITDIKVNLEGDFDKLEKIFELQGKLKEKYDVIERGKGSFVPYIPIDINGSLTQEYLKSLFYRIHAELFEASECLRNKLWKQSEVITDVDHLFEELADGLHFYIELCINLGIDANKLFELYFKKQEVNKWRQATKY